MKPIDRRVRTVIFADTQQITEETITYYEKHPDELDLILDREFFNLAFLTIFFFLGLGITISARVIQYFYGDALGEFVNSVVLDVISELGIAIFGGAVVAYLIEYLNKRQYQENIKFRREVKARIEERKKKQGS